MDDQENSDRYEDKASEPAQVVSLTIGMHRALNVALWSNNVPLVSDITLVNTRPEPLRNVEVEFTAEPSAIASKIWHLADIGAGQVRVMRDLDLDIDGQLLQSLTESVRGTATICVRADGEPLAEERRDLRLLAHNEWGGNDQIPDILAAFVEPNDPAVATILRKASDQLRAQGLPDSIEGYQATSKRRVWEQLSAVWSAVCSLDLRYVNPPPSFERTGQRIRPPSQILNDGLATCLDLAVLFAACIEHAGIRPVIVLTQGHALAGAWLSTRDFGTSVADDAPGLRTRLALDDLLLFETTLCCQSPAPTFTRAIAVGRDEVSAANDERFETIVDIHRARQRRILPLGGRKAEYSRQTPGNDEGTAPPVIEAAPHLREDDDNDGPPEAAATPAGRLERWRQRLLDLSGRNRLLNLRTGGRQALQVDCPDVIALAKLLSDMRGRPKSSPIRVRPWPDLMSGRDPRSAHIHRNRMAENEDRAFAMAALAKRELLVGRDENQLQTSLTEIYRAARSAQQEGGANTLFLTIGSLLWRAKGKEKPYRAPLILVPMVLERPSVRSGFVLRIHDDETRLNSTLIELLRQEFDIRFPGLDENLPNEGSGEDVQVVLDAFRKKARDIPGWEISDDVALTNLSFAKYLMWKDLADRADALRQSPVAARLMDGPNAQNQGRLTGVPQGLEQEGGAADDGSETQGLVCPLEADSSQVRAIAAASRGDSFVLIGPPGTGKSQTIANIITNALAKGQSVLFVAEKRAALEVVQRRMKQVGLDEFCLDLFSAKASKSVVLEQLNRAQQAQAAISEDEWLRVGADTAALKNELNAYVRELHRRGRNGWTAFRAIGCLLRAESGGVPDLGLAWHDADIHDVGAYQRLVESVEEAAATFARLGDEAVSAPLEGIDYSDWSPAWQARLVEASRAAAVELDSLESAAAAAVRVLELPADTRLTQVLIAQIDVLAGLLLEPEAPASVWALADATGELAEQITLGAALADEREALVTKTSGRWRIPVPDLPLSELASQWREASGRWLVPRLSAHRSIRAKLAAAAHGKIPKDPLNDIDTLISIQEKDTQIAALGPMVEPVLGRRWRNHETDFERLRIELALARQIRAAVAGCTSAPSVLLALRDHVRRLLSDGADLLAPSGTVGAALQTLRTCFARVQQALDAISPLSGCDPRDLAGDDDPWPAGLASHLRGWADSGRHLRDWCAWRGVAQRADDLGLGPVLSGMQMGTFEARDATRVFEANYARWWVGAAVESLPQVRSFVAGRHEQRIARFRALDARMIELAARYCRTQIARGIPSAEVRQKSADYVLLARELTKKQRHLPIRQLVARMPNAIRGLTPCLMMSPLSVAQYIPADAAAFDLIIFDEASQIPTWDAIGAVGRGRQVVVVGDPKQLPPSRFFERALPDLDDAGAEAGPGSIEVEREDLESILDECLGAAIPSIELSWHYRSRHEGLIAFSNHVYYGGRLVTFPSPVVRDAAVSYRHVPDGVYARGRARTNQAEARAVVTAVLERLRGGLSKRRVPSIGVVTFNSEQQTLIEDLLDKARREEPHLEMFFSDEYPEPVMVKNLESVQGEERDVIFFSITYGPDASGRVAMNFGPLNQSGGERRLNVAITRAREALVVFGSLRPEHIDIARTAATGVTHLKQFLSFAQHGALAFATSSSGSQGDFESPFEAAVAERLRALGWQLHPQIGVSGFRVDLGIVDPDAPGAFLAGVECDGATYHRAAAARDRDRLRQAVLEGLGWRILRVWSTDWWTNAHREAGRLHEALNKLLQYKRNETAALHSGMPNPSIDPPTIVPVTTGSSDSNAGTAPRRTRIDVDDLDPLRFYDDDYRETLARLVAAVIDVEGPLRDDRLAQRVARSHKFQRTGRRIRDVVDALVPATCAVTSEGPSTFVWPPGVDPAAWTIFRAPDDGASRDPGDVPMQELVALARQVLDETTDPDEALLRMRDACGLGALRDAARARCLEALRKAQPSLL